MTEFHSTAPRAVVERYYAQVWTARRPQEVDGLFAPEYVNHAGARGVLAGTAGIRTNYQSLVDAFPDVSFDLDDVLVDGDKVVVRYTMHGTHRGQFQQIAPTGKTVSVPGIGIYRVSAGLIRESWVVRDSLVLLRQLGAA